MKSSPCVLLVSCRMLNDPSSLLIREAYRAERLKPQIVLVEKPVGERSLPELIRDGVIVPQSLSNLIEPREFPQPSRPTHRSSAFYVRFLNKRRGRKKR